MLTDNDINFEFNGILGMALVWVIEDNCLYDLPLSKEHAEMFLSVTKSEDVSAEYPDHNGITVRLFKNDEILEDLQTTEYFGSILLSEPLVLDLFKYPYGRYVESPNAKFINNSFVITDRDISGRLP